MDTQLNSEPINNKVKLNFKDSKYATGRRKKSIARVWLKKGTGNIQINGKRMDEYFKKLNLRIAILRPLSIVNREKEYDIRCTVSGGGLSGQAGAISHGLARALIEYEPELKPTLKKEKLTTRDSDLLSVKNTVIEKQEEAFSFPKDKSLLKYLLRLITDII